MKRLIFFLVIILSSLEVSHGIFGRKKKRCNNEPPDPWGEENAENGVEPSSISRELLKLEQHLNGNDIEGPYPRDPYFPYGPGKCPRQQWGCPCANNEDEEEESGETGCWGKKKGKKKKNKKKKNKKKKEKKKKEKKKKEKKNKCKSPFWKKTTPDPNESIYDNV